MPKKKIFIEKNKSSKNKLLIILISFIIFLFFYFFIINLQINYFDIPAYEKTFYIYPKDKGGLKISNLDKKSLHLDSINTNDDKIVNNISLKFSIQLFVSDKYNLVKEKLDYFVHKNIYDINDFYIIVFNHNLGKDYFLLFKNFETSQLAHEYCSKISFFINKCTIIDVSKIE